MPPFFSKASYSRILKLMFACILLLGLGLRIYQYLMGRSLWEDEAHLALNFIYHDYAGLLNSLSYAQAAPIFFLFSLETLSLIFGFGPYVLRFFPFIVTLLSFPLFYFLCLELLRSRVASLTAFLLFAMNLALIYFSSEMKPYTIDVAVYVCMCFVACTPTPFIAKRRHVWLAAAGCLSILFSSVAFIVLACVAGPILLQWVKNKRIVRTELLMFLLWALILFVNYMLFIRTYGHAEETKAGWAQAFCPTDLLSCEFVNFLKKTLDETFFGLLFSFVKFPGAAFLLVLIFGAGLRNIIRGKDHLLLFYCCFPIVLHLAISALKLYPFYYRFILYLLPAFIILLLSGIHAIAGFVLRKVHVSGAVVFYVACVCFCIWPSIGHYPVRLVEIKPVLDYINKHYPERNLWVASPYTLYRYYHLTGVAKNGNYRPVQWDISAGQFQDMMMTENANYVLVWSTGSSLGNFSELVRALKKKKLVVNEFESGSYAIAELRPSHAHAHIITNRDFEPIAALELDGQPVIALWGGEQASRPQRMNPGKYKISILSKGTPLAGEYPRVKVMLNDQRLGNFTALTEYKPQHFSAEIGDEAFSVRFIMENDANDTISGEDRNVFIKSISFDPEKPAE